MKKVILQITLLFATALHVLAQAPQALNYQGVARNASGTPIGGQAIGLQITIHDGSPTGTVVYQEAQSTTTNSFGLYNISVGTGTASTGSFNSINWGTGYKYMEVGIDPAGGTTYVTAGTSELLSVPYALYAASSPPNGVTSVVAGTGLAGGTITSTGTISLPNTGTPGTFGSATQVPVFTTDAEGRVTGVTNTAIVAGTVTSINTTPGQITGGPITTSGTLGLAPAGTAGTYGDATHIPVLTTDTYGRVTSVSNTLLSAGSVTSVSSTNLSPLFSTSVLTPTTTPAISYSLTPVAAHNFFGGGTSVTGAPGYRTLAASDIPALPYVSSVTAGTGLTGGIITGTGTINMPSVGTAGTYGSGTVVPVITTDAQGRVTGITNAPISVGGIGTVTTVNTTPGQLTGGPITSSGTLGLAPAGTAGTYGSATQIPVLTTDAYGRVTAVSTSTIAAGSVTAVTAGTGLSGGIITSTGTISMPGVGTAGTYGSASTVPVFTTDAEGRVTGVTNTPIAGPGIGTVSSVTAGTGLTGGTITGTGTISMPNVGTAGTYGSATQIPVITTDAEGRVTGITNTPFTAGTGTVTTINTTAGQLTGGPITTGGTLGLASAGTAGTYGSATQVPVFTTDAYGRVISVTSTGITGLINAGTTNYVSKFTSATALGNSQIFDNGTAAVGIGTSTPSTSDKLEVINPSTSTFTSAVHGISGSNASGVIGSDFGVLGETNTGIGVGGVSSGASGIYGWSLAAAYAGVFGTNTNGGYGLWGTVTGTGAAGYFDGGTSGGYGVVVKQGNSGFNTSTPTNMSKVEISGVGTYSVAPAYQAGLIVDGTTTASASGVYAEGGWRGVYGHNLGTSSGIEAIGVLGRLEGSSYTGIGYGVKGENAGTGGTANYGVFGTASGTGNGVGALITGTGAAGYFDGGTGGGYGVLVKEGNSGFNTVTPTNMAKVEISGVGSYSVAPAYQAGLIVDGTTTASATGVYAEGGWKGVYGHNLGTAAGIQAVGVHGRSEGSSYSTGYGVLAEAVGTGPTNYGIYATGTNGTSTNYAGYFNGAIYAISASASIKAFKIDDPRDPANKYLYHSSVESNEMINIYKGHVVTDASGEATVTLPSYFSVLNKDIEYQLTCVGQFAQAIVSDEVNGSNQFKIKTDKPNVKVSWQVSGVRQDPVANAYRIQDEVEKPAGEKGTYLTPELYGQGPEKVPGYPKATNGASANTQPVR